MLCGYTRSLIAVFAFFCGCRRKRGIYLLCVCVCVIHLNIKTSKNKLLCLKVSIIEIML